MAVNRRVRVGEGVSGTIVVLGVWCSTCKEEVGPDRRGCCPWCFRAVLDEDSLPARAMLEQLRRNGSGREPRGPSDPQRAAPSRPGITWMQGRIIAAIQAWHAEHGEPPRVTDWIRRSENRPTAQTVIDRFGKWNTAISAAGFEPRRRGGVYPKKPEQLCER